MSQNTTRRLGAVLVALLVACSFAGGPVIAAAAASGTVGDGVGSTFDSDDDSTDSSTSDGDDSWDDGTEDGTDDDGDGTADSSDDSTTSTSSSDDSTGDDGESSQGDSTDDSSDGSGDADAENVTDAVEETVAETGEAVAETGEAVDETADHLTSTGVHLVGSATGDSDLDGTLDLAGDDDRADGDPSSDAGERLSPRRGTADTDVADARADARASSDDRPDVGAVDSSDRGSLTAGGDGGQPIPDGLAGGATLGVGVVAAAAVVRSTPLVAGSTSSGAGTAATGYLSTLLERFKPFVFPFRYSRYDDSDPLEHEARELVYEIVNDTPGSYLSEVSERADLPLSTTRHHMKVLEREELVSGAKLRGKRRFYPAYAEGIELAAALNDDSTASIIDALSRLGAASVSDLADELGRDPSTISHHLQRLEEDEIITRERQGRAVVNKLSAEARTALEPDTTPRPGEAAEALAD